MEVVADSSPLCHLALIGKLDLLRQLFGSVIVPPTVLSELQHPKAPLPARDVGQNPPPWLQICQPGKIVSIPRLHPGEEAAIGLAYERHALLIIDERVARQVASTPPWTLKIMGTLGVLEMASAQQLVDLRQAAAALLKTGFRIDRQLVEDALRRSPSS